MVPKSRLGLGRSAHNAGTKVVACRPPAREASPGQVDHRINTRQARRPSSDLSEVQRAEHTRKTILDVLPVLSRDHPGIYNNAVAAVSVTIALLITRVVECLSDTRLDALERVNCLRHGSSLVRCRRKVLKHCTCQAESEAETCSLSSLSRPSE